MSFELQAAIKAALEADAGLIAALGQVHVYDFVPPGAARPYLFFANWQETEAGDGDQRLAQATVSLRIASNYQGFKEVKTLAELVEAALHHAALTMTHTALVDLRLLGASFAREAQQDLSLAEVRFFALTQAL